MAQASGHAKLCVVCGTDCSNKPRTKDPKGRYFCKECYDKAKAGHKPANAAPVRPLPRPKPVADPLDLGLDNDAGLLEPLNVLDDLIEAPPAAAATSSCPGCGSAMTASAVICTNCGYNAQTHAAVGKTQVLKTPKQPGGGGNVWPWFVGITSMVFGGCGVLLYAVSLVTQVLRSLNASAASIGQVAGVGLGIGLSAWLLRDGWRIIHHDSSAVSSIRVWAVIKLLIYGTCFAIMIAMPLGDGLQRGSGGRGTPFGGIDLAMLKTVLVLTAAWFCFWPVFVLIFFSVPRIKANVAQWG